MLTMLKHIYRDMCFQVRGHGHSSSQRRQRSGISQGCPLSPFLFVMLMSTIVKDAVDQLSSTAKNDLSSNFLSILLYADDTLLIVLALEEISIASGKLRHGSHHPGR